MSRVVTLPVRNLFTAAPRSRILRLALGATPFHYRAGQSVALGMHGQPLRRPYSIACAPEEATKHRYLEFLIRVDASGHAGAHLAGLTRGARLDVEGPFGTLAFPEALSDRAFLFVAGGTGIAPVRAMIWHVLLTRRAARIGVLYSARAPGEFAYGRDLRRLARTGRIRLMLTVSREAGPSWTGERGRINLARLSAMIEDPTTLCCLCGPSPLVTTVTSLLRALGIPAGRIRTEEW